MVPVLLAGALLPAGPAQIMAQSATATPSATVDQNSQPGARVEQAEGNKSFEDLSPEDLFAQPQYETLKPQWEKDYQPATGVNVDVAPERFTDSTGREGLQTANGYQGRPGTTLLWTKDDGYVEWTVDVPRTGLYEITLDYYPLPGQGGEVQRELYLDGQLPFREARRIVFERVWHDQYWPPQRDNQGNDVRPPQVEAPQWMSKTIEDADGHYDAPFAFPFTQGKHTIRLQAVREPIAIGGLHLHAPKVVPTYEQRLAEWRAKGYQPVSGGAQIVFQAEKIYLKSDPTIRGEVDFDALAQPYADGLDRLNSFGWGRWHLYGQWASWQFTVPQSGLYQISMNVWQGWSGRRPRLRWLKIDGELPFAEMGDVTFRTNRDHRLETMRPGQDANQQPYLFYLSQGQHTLTMGVTLGFMAQTMRVLNDDLVEMSTLTRQMLMVTGPKPDPNMEWELAEQIPDLLPRLQKVADTLETEAQRMDREGQSHSDASSAFRLAESQVRQMISRPHDMHRMIDDFERSQGILADWVINLNDHKLAIDWFDVHAPDAKLPRVKANIFDQTMASFKIFLLSFTRSYTGVGSVYGKGGSDTVLEVWVGRGTEWGQIMKDMIEDTFTPQTGIKVNLHIIPPANLGSGSGSVLVLALTSGEAPDVAVGVPSDVPVDFAVRGALTDVSSFPDYAQVSQRFRPGALVPFHYQLPGQSAGGDWALPETQDFWMLFYRTDILNELGLKPPETWEDLYDALFKMQQNGLDFYYPTTSAQTVQESASGFTPFLFQDGGSYYRCEQFCRSNLTSPEALDAFQEWTDLYSSYKVPISANFFTRFRDGEMPMGVSGYNTYVSLSVAAPELTGRWEMRPMPGHRKPDGSIDRSSGGTGQAAVIFKQSKQQAAAWEFVKWWTSESAQQRFGNELEALLGVEARWNTANLAALQDLPWPKRDISSIMEQWSWFREPPVVLGGYFTTRHVVNAWNRVVLQGANPREALEDAVFDINRELGSKQEEFGLKVDPSMFRRGGGS